MAFGGIIDHWSFQEVQSRKLTFSHLEPCLLPRDRAIPRLGGMFRGWIFICTSSRVLQTSLPYWAITACWPFTCYHHHISSSTSPPRACTTPFFLNLIHLSITYFIIIVASTSGKSFPVIWFAFHSLSSWIKNPTCLADILSAHMDGPFGHV